MPVITVKLAKGRTLEQKQRFVAEVTQRSCSMNMKEIIGHLMESYIV